MIRGGTAADAMPSTRARGFRPCAFTASSLARMMAAAPSLTPEALPAVMVPGLRTIGLSLARLSSVVSGADVLVLVDDDRPGFAARRLHRHDLLGKIAGRGGFAGALLRAQRKSVLILARNLEFFGDVLGGLRHRSRRRIAP